MIIRIATLLFVIFHTFCGPAMGAEKFQLTPRQSQHQFAFFSSPTPVWAYNGTIPGPLIRATQGTTLEIDLFNQLKEATSVHWHGLRIDNAMDGVPGVTQAPIRPDTHFIYRLRLEEAGTYWYHPHFNAGEQLERGLKGALIVEEKKPLPWSEDIVWLIDDWRFQQDGQIYPHFNIHPDLMHDGRWGNAITVNGTHGPELSVAPGERIRLRLINGANARILSVSLPGLPATVMAVDARPVSRLFPLTSFTLSPGNRIDLDITVPEGAAGKRFYLEDQFTGENILLGKINVSDSVSKPTPGFTSPTAPDYIPAELFKNLEVEKTWDLRAVRGGKFGIGWAMNRQLWPEADKATFEIGRPVKIRFRNDSNRLHPMHIHGAFFRVLEVNGQPVPEPFTRDTALVGPGETMIIGLVPEYAGIWMTHCHIQAHADSGMMTTIKVK